MKDKAEFGTGGSKKNSQPSTMPEKIRRLRKWYTGPGLRKGLAQNA